MQETEPVEAVVEEKAEETVSGGNIEVPEVEETEVLETEETSETTVQTAEATVAVVQSTDGQYVFDAATDSVVSKLEKKDKIVAGKYGTEGYFLLVAR